MMMGNEMGMGMGFGEVEGKESRYVAWRTCFTAQEQKQHRAVGGLVQWAGAQLGLADGGSLRGSAADRSGQTEHTSHPQRFQALSSAAFPHQPQRGITELQGPHALFAAGGFYPAMLKKHYKQSQSTINK